MPCSRSIPIQASREEFDLRISHAISVQAFHDQEEARLEAELTQIQEQLATICQNRATIAKHLAAAQQEQHLLIQELVSIYTKRGEYEKQLEKIQTDKFKQIEVLSILENKRGKLRSDLTCGTWHSALATANGKLFTFGDGTFGVLGHGDRESVLYPKEVQLLSRFRTLKVACGVWHTAAIIEVTLQSSSNVSSRKLFTWGDGDQYRLGHGNKETYLQPTCVSYLIEACGNTMTVAPTTSGHIFTMGGTEHGQLRNSLSDGKVPMLVQDKLVGEYVEEISCGSHHVAVLTLRSELYTWGKDANGRLGHGDTEDRKGPIIVEVLKERHVKNISCGSKFTACICIHKWVSGVEQSSCTACRQPFRFTRKRHNCYNCGLVHCHGCSSKKALRAALAPTPGKPHRVCDSCYTKIKNVESNSGAIFNRRATTPPRTSIDGRERFTLGEIRSSRTLFPLSRIHKTTTEQVVQVPSLVQLKDVAFPSSTGSIMQNLLKPTIAAIPPTPSPPPTPSLISRPASPYARRPSPTRSGAGGFSRSLLDSLRKTNELKNQEVSKLQKQIQSLKQKSNMKDVENQKLRQHIKEATTLAADESSKHKAMLEIFECTIIQLKQMAEKLPPEISETENLRIALTQAEDFLKENSTSETFSVPSISESTRQNAPDPATDIGDSKMQENGSSVSDNRTAVQPQSSEETSRLARDGETQVIEQFEPGIYVTLIVRPNGVKIFRRVRFSKRRFHEQQAEEWWNINKERVLQRYGQQARSDANASFSTPTPPAEENIEVAPT
ncbi:PH, RCC1 and FYVE domains-containing protein 1-like [Arachis hypogaea]|uniref:PH, RCC1 and FYVE domains-containing protein 1-like n=1 Tax=Arachis hypogaea TaxID=3818 RepID=UPI0011057236|nr:PH, RCC1 and FYVE domains-containing protein 1-like [Arachis hypogaea]